MISGICNRGPFKLGTYLVKIHGNTYIESLNKIIDIVVFINVL